MSEPTKPPQPEPKFWETLPQIAGRLKNEFLLVTLGILILVVAIGLFAPGVGASLGQGFFYLLVVLAWLAYIGGRLLDAWLKMRQPSAPGAGTKPAPPAPQPDPPPSPPQATAEQGSATASGGSVANLGDGNINISGDVAGDLTITQGPVDAAAPGGRPAAPPPTSGGYDLAVVRDLLLAAFTAPDLRRFFLYTTNPRLRPLTQEFGPNDGLTDMAETTVEFCRTRDLLPDLLGEVEGANPRQYANFAGRLEVSSQ